MRTAVKPVNSGICACTAWLATPWEYNYAARLHADPLYVFARVQMRVLFATVNLGAPLLCEFRVEATRDAAGFRRSFSRAALSSAFTISKWFRN